MKHTTKEQIQAAYVNELLRASIYQRSLIRSAGKRRMRHALRGIGITGIGASNAIHEAIQNGEWALELKDNDWDQGRTQEVSDGR